MKVLAEFGGVIGVVLLRFFVSILNGYALSVLWKWFVVPTFGAPALGLVPAIGVAMTVSYLTHQTHDCKKEEKSFGEKIEKRITIAILNLSFVLFLGWIVHMFM